MYRRARGDSNTVIGEEEKEVWDFKRGWGVRKGKGS